MTNADKIRQMSIEQLAELIDDSKPFFNCSMCQYEPPYGTCTTPCVKPILEWLKQEAPE